MLKILTCVTALVGGMVSFPEASALPQDASAAPAPQAEEEDIVVLRKRAGATKIDAPVRDLPQAISTISREVLEDREIVRLEEIADATVGIRPTLPFVGGVSLGFFVRGFNGAPVLVDGVNAGVTAGSTSTVQNLAVTERVEILRGPASVLYGQGNPGGVINIVLKRPEERFGWAVDATWDSFGARRVNADVTGGLGLDGLSGRLIASFEDSETFRDFGVVRRLAAAPQIAWSFDPRTQLEVRYIYDDYTFNADRGFGFDGTLLRLNAPVDRNLAEPTLELNTIVSQTLRAKLSRDIARDWTASLDFSGYRYELREGEQIDFIAPLPGTLLVQRFLTVYGEPEDNTQQDWTLSGTLQGDTRFLGLRHQIFASAERVESRNNFSGVFDAIPPIDALAPVYSPTPLTLSVEEPFEGTFQSRTTAVYLQDLISIGEQWKLLVGGRFDSIQTEFFDDAERNDLNTQQRDNVFTPRAGLVWQPSDKTSLYASYSRSFLPQVFTDRFNNAPDPERATAYEIGFKRLVLDGRGSITGSLYNIRQSGLVAFDPDDLGVLVNAGEGRSRGFELEFDLRPDDHWTLAGGVALTDAEIVESDIAEPGATLPGAARWTATFFGKYAFRGALEGLSANLGANYVSDTPWVQPPRGPDLPSFVKLDLGLEYELPRGFEFRATVENLLNERILLANGFGLTGPASPRAVLLTLTWRGGSLAR